jgi:fibronectin-binding autotransporter adhesin
MSGGSLNDSAAFIGQAGVGIFSQSGGTHTISNILYVYSTYILSSSGQLTSNYEYISGQFQQSGGTNTSNSILIVTNGKYQLSGGVLQINGGLENKGTFDFCSSPGTLNATNSIVNFAQPGGTIKNTQSATLNIGTNSLLIIPSGFNPATAFAHYSNAGIEHVRGTTLSVASSQTIIGCGTIDDPVVCQGTISPIPGESILMDNGLIISGNGNVKITDNSNIGEVLLKTNDLTSGMSGGSLSANTHIVGFSTNGTFTQSGGSSTVQGLVVGRGSNNTGTYNLSGGQLTVNGSIATLGQGGVGIFNQSGGTFSIPNASLLISNGTGVKGTYNLTGGTLVAHSILSNGGGAATFNFGGGTIQACGNLNCMAMNLTGIGGDATIDSAGFMVQVLGLTGRGGLNKRGSNYLMLSDSKNNYLGDTKVYGGLLLIGADLSSSTLDCNSYGGTIGFGSNVCLGGLKGNQDLSLNVAPEFFPGPVPPMPVALQIGNNGKSTTYSGILSGLGSLEKIGSGTLTLSGANTYSGGTRITNGILNINNAMALGLGPLTVDVYNTIAIDNTSGSAITISTNNTHNWWGNLTFIGTNDLNLGTGNIPKFSQITCLSGNLTIGSVLAGTGPLIKAGAGALTLTASNSYSGKTTIKGGTLNIEGGISSTGTKLIDVQSGDVVFKTTNINKPDLDIQTSGSSIFEIVDGTHVVGTISGTGITQVDNGSLSATSIVQNTLSIGTAGKAGVCSYSTESTLQTVPEPGVFMLLAISGFVLFMHSYWKKM